MTRDVWHRAAKQRHRLYDILAWLDWRPDRRDRGPADRLANSRELARYVSLFTAIELFSLIVFTIEFGLRVWVDARARSA